MGTMNLEGWTESDCLYLHPIFITSISMYLSNNGVDLIHKILILYYTV